MTSRVFQEFSLVTVSIPLFLQGRHLERSPVFWVYSTLNLRERFSEALVSPGVQSLRPTLATLELKVVERRGWLVYMRNLAICSLLPRMAFERVLEPFDPFRMVD